MADWRPEPTTTPESAGGAETDSAGTPPVRLDIFMERLAEVGIEEIAAEAIQLYLSESRQRFDELAAAVERQDAEEIGPLAHSLRSASLNIWAVGLGELLDELESAGKSSDLERVGELFRRVQGEFADVVSYLSSELTELG